MLVLEPLDIPSRRLAGQARRAPPARRGAGDLRRRWSARGRLGDAPLPGHAARAAGADRRAGRTGSAARSSTSTPRCPSPRVPGTETSTPATSRSSPGRVPVWDWERFEEGVPGRIRPAAPRAAPIDHRRGASPAGGRRSDWSRESAATLAPLGVEPAAADAGGPHLPGHAGLPLPGRRPGGRRRPTWGRCTTGCCPRSRRCRHERTRRRRGALAPRPLSAPAPRRPDPRGRRHRGPGPPRPARRAARPDAERPAAAGARPPALRLGADEPRRGHAALPAERARRRARPRVAAADLGSGLPGAAPALRPRQTWPR